MTIDDDYFDVSDTVEGTDVEDSFDRIMKYLRDIELENEELRVANSQLETTIKTMMALKENKPYRPPSSPYDLSKGDKGFKGLRR